MMMRYAVIQILFLLFVLSSPQQAFSAGICGDVNEDGKVNIADLYKAKMVIQNETYDEIDQYWVRLDVGPLKRNASSGDLIKVFTDGEWKAQPDPDGNYDDFDIQVIEQIILKKIKLNCAP